jgi:tellurite resistance protein TerB
MNWFQQFRADMKQKVARYNNSTFKDAAMGTCALIAAADGSVDASERAKVVSLIANTEALQVFESTALGQLFKDYCDKATNEFARFDVLKAVGKLRSDPAAADVCIRVALIVANADGDFSAPEQKVVRELCGVLGLPAADYLPAQAA